MRRLRRVGLGIAFAAAVPFVAPGPASACTLPGTPDAGFEPPQDFLGTVTSAHQGAYVQIPFNVPAGTTAIRIRYCNDGVPAGTTLDMGVYEPLHAGSAIAGTAERRGWSGSAVKDLAIAVNGFSPPSVYESDRKAYVHGYTTRAYQPGTIPPGQWTAELGVAALGGPAVDFQVTGRDQLERRLVQPAVLEGRSERCARQSQRRLVRGRRARARRAGTRERAGLDQPRLRLQTARCRWRGPRLGRPGRPQQRRQPRRDRQVRAQLSRQAGDPRNRGNDLPRPLQLDRVERLCRLPRRTGAQLPVDDPGRGGHPPRDPARPPAVGRRLDPDQPPDDLRRRAPRASVAAAPGTGPIRRPTTRRSTRSRLQTGPADLGGAQNPFTPTAIAFYEQRLAAGDHIAAVGSSDSHQADQADLTTAPIGRGSTVVYATELSKPAIVQGIRDDHTYVKPYGNDGPDIRVTARSPGAADAIIGDTIRGPNRCELDVQVLRAGPGATRPGDYLALLLRDGAVADQVQVTSDDFTTNFESARAGRYSIEVIREDPAANRIEVYSSPVWYEVADNLKLGKLKRKARNGTAKLTATVGGPGRAHPQGEGPEDGPQDRRRRRQGEVEGQAEGQARQGAARGRQREGEGEGEAGTRRRARRQGRPRS